MATIKLNTFEPFNPQCYAYTTPGVPKHDGWTKIGFTKRDADIRVGEQTHTVGVEPVIHWVMRAAYLTKPYDFFTDTQFHEYLKKLNIARDGKTEWFKIDPKTAEEYFLNFARFHGALTANDADPVMPYTLREEQAQAVQKTIDYFQKQPNGEFLWNAKPRFGKTLTAYHLAMELGAKTILIVTNRPAIAKSWYDDYKKFLGTQSGYLFISNVPGIKGERFVVSREEYYAISNSNPVKGYIEFVSLQDLKGSIYFGGSIDKLSELSAEKGMRFGI